MAQLPGWMPILLDRISWGCSTSPQFVNLADEVQVLDIGRETCRDLWPFIKELPSNIAAVRDNVPEWMTAARQLLDQLADDERHYQQLFRDQCVLADFDPDSQQRADWSQETVEMVAEMERLCQRSPYVDGICAIVAAEFAATLFSRNALPSYEKYFEKNAHQYPPGAVPRGLEWLRLHAKTHTKHARWMKQMLGDIDDYQGNEVPEAAEIVLNCVLKLWRCPPEESRQTPPRTARIRN